MYGNTRILPLVLTTGVQPSFKFAGPEFKEHCDQHSSCLLASQLQSSMVYLPVFQAPFVTFHSRSQFPSEV